MSNEENRADIAAEETVDTDSSKHIIKHLEKQETLVDIFTQRTRTPGSSNEEPPAKRIRPQTSTDTRANAKCVTQEDHGVARANAEQGNRYVDTSNEEEIPDDSTRTILILRLLSCLLSEIPQIK